MVIPTRWNASFYAGSQPSLSSSVPFTVPYPVWCVNFKNIPQTFVFLNYHGKTNTIPVAPCPKRPHKKRYSPPIWRTQAALATTSPGPLYFVDTSPALKSCFLSPPLEKKTRPTYFFPCVTDFWAHAGNTLFCCIASFPSAQTVLKHSPRISALRVARQ